MFAEAFSQSLDLNLKDSGTMKVPFDFVNGSQEMYKKNDLKQYQQSGLEDKYVQMVYAMDKLLPFYQYFFTFYKTNKRLVVLDLMRSLRIYDEQLFSMFIKKI
jgi:hypothetical protein